MNRLLKAEWYRMTKLMRFWLMVLVLILFGAVVPFIDKPANAGEYLMIAGSDSAMLMIVFVAMISSVLTAIVFGNRTVYYEVMSGKRPMKIIISKCLVIGGTITGIMCLGYLVAVAIFGSIKGYGEMTNVCTRLLIFFVVILHSSIVGVLIVTTFRSAIGAAFCYLRFMIVDTVICSIAEFVYQDSPSKMMKVYRWTLMGEPKEIFAGKISGGMICAIILSFAVEVLLWGGLSYIFMKKRLYK